ncbi:MAG TPA: TIGR04290 family methyltransferase [Myxococcaceae bacterium]|nr:TIGR04290 family methyltransferase [Myxococcaceae bacterium]
MSTPHPSAPLTRQEIEQRVRSLGDWFHNLDLQGVHTAPNHVLGDSPAINWRRIQHARPADLTGRSVLDIGCNAGFYALEMKRRGAARVLAIDSDERYLEQGRFAAEVNGLEIEFRKLDVYDVASLRERFDLVLFLGVLYHLRHPLLALDLLHAHAVKDLLLFQSMQRGSRRVEPLEHDYPIEETEVFDQPGFPKLHFVEREYSHDWTNWWVPNRACAEAMLRSAGFDILSNVWTEFYLCRRRELEPRERTARAVYPRT